MVISQRPTDHPLEVCFSLFYLEPIFEKDQQPLKAVVFFSIGRMWVVHASLAFTSEHSFTVPKSSPSDMPSQEFRLLMDFCFLASDNWNPFVASLHIQFTFYQQGVAACANLDQRVLGVLRRLCTIGLDSVVQNVNIIEAVLHLVKDVYPSAWDRLTDSNQNRDETFRADCEYFSSQVTGILVSLRCVIRKLERLQSSIQAVSSRGSLEICYLY